MAPPEPPQVVCLIRNYGNAAATTAPGTPRFLFRAPVRFWENRHAVPPDRSIPPQPLARPFRALTTASVPLLLPFFGLVLSKDPCRSPPAPSSPILVSAARPPVSFHVSPISGAPSRFQSRSAACTCCNSVFTGTAGSRSFPSSGADRSDDGQHSGAASCPKQGRFIGRTPTLYLCVTSFLHYRCLLVIAMPPSLCSCP